MAITIAKDANSGGTILPPTRITGVRITVVAAAASDISIADQTAAVACPSTSTKQQRRGSDKLDGVRRTPDTEVKFRQFLR
jgi:hypothetical protein